MLAMFLAMLWKSLPLLLGILKWTDIRRVEKPRVQRQYSGDDHNPLGEFLFTSQYFIFMTSRVQNTAGAAFMPGDPRISRLIVWKTEAKGMTLSNWMVTLGSIATSPLETVGNRWFCQGFPLLGLGEIPTTGCWIGALEPVVCGYDGTMGWVSLLS
jgi:hypothetical protein